jgi:hypothetical protein
MYGWNLRQGSVKRRLTVRKSASSLSASVLPACDENDSCLGILSGIFQKKKKKKNRLKRKEGRNRRET